MRPAASQTRAPLGTSPPLALRQRLHQRCHRWRIDRSGDPHSTASANSISITPGLSATGGRDAGLGHDCGLIERRRNLRPMKQASVPSADQGDEAAGFGHRPDNAPKSRQDLVQATAAWSTWLPQSVD